MIICCKKKRSYFSQLNVVLETFHTSGMSPRFMYVSLGNHPQQCIAAKIVFD